MGIKAWAATTAFVAGTSVASLGLAATIEFYLGGTGTSNISDNAWSGVDEGVTLTVTPGSFVTNVEGVPGVVTTTGPIVGGTTLAGNDFDANALLTQSAMGLGVRNNSLTGTDDNPFDVDGSGWKDFLILEFSEAVTLDYFNFSGMGSSESFQILYDVNNNGVLGDDGDFASGLFTGQANFTDFLGVENTLFGVLSPGDTDIWSLHSVGASTIDDDGGPGGEGGGDPTPSPVPLPAAGFLLLAGLGGLALARRRV